MAKPFVSKAQHERFKALVAEGKMPQAALDEAEAATPNLADLPERLHPKKEEKPCEIVTPFQGQEIDDVPLEVLTKWLADVGPKFEKFPPKEHRLAVWEAVKARVAKEQGNG